MMRATASKDVQYAAHAKEVSRRITVPAAPYPTSHLQRKACPCGGTCPRCRDALPIQTKLTISEPGDPYEQEADRIADQVLAAPPHLPVNGAPPHIQRFAGQRTGQPNTSPASVEQALAGSSQPLEPTLRQDMEQRFGYDFSRVRLHTGVAAEQSARDVNARAYTVGHDVVFGARQFGPGTTQGRRLLAHELTHVVQQSGPEGIRLKQSSENRGLSLVHEPVHVIQQGAASLLPSGSEYGQLLNTAGIGSQSAAVPVADAERLAGRIDTRPDVGTQVRQSVTLMRSGVDPEPPGSEEFLDERPPKFRKVVVGSWGQSLPAQLVAQERLDTSFLERDYTRAAELATALRAPSVIMREYDRLWIYTLGWEGLSTLFSRFTNASTIRALASPEDLEAGVYSASNVIGYEDVEAFVTEDGGVLRPTGAGAGKLFVHTGGEFEETLVSAGQNAGAFIGGLVKGLSDANFAALAERLQSMEKLNTVFPLPFAVGALHGVANEIVDFLKLLDWEHLKAIGAAFQQTVLLLIDPDGEELAASLGEEVGRTQAASMDKLLKKDLVTFSYEVGKLVGPTIAEIVLAFLGYEVGPLKLLSMTLKKAPKLDGVLSHATDVFADTPDIPGFPRRQVDTPQTPHVGGEVTEPRGGGGPGAPSERTPPAAGTGRGLYPVVDIGGGHTLSYDGRTLWVCSWPCDEFRLRYRRELVADRGMQADLDRIERDMDAAQAAGDFAARDRHLEEAILLEGRLGTSHFEHLALDLEDGVRKPAEAAGGLLLENVIGRSLERLDPHSHVIQHQGKGGDLWDPIAQRSYDHTGGDARFGSGDVMGDVYKHLEKEGVDVVLVDVTQMDPKVTAQVRADIQKLWPLEFARGPVGSVTSRRGIVIVP